MRLDILLSILKKKNVCIYTVEVPEARIRFRYTTLRGTSSFTYGPSNLKKSDST